MSEFFSDLASAMTASFNDIAKTTGLASDIKAAEKEWNEITDISYGFGLTPIIAHVHRCIDYYSKSELEELLRLDAVFQINNEAFGNHKERQFVKNLIKEGYPYLFGSDAHNLSGRRPNWDLLKKKVRADVIDNAEVILRQL